MTEAAADITTPPEGGEPTPKPGEEATTPPEGGDAAGKPETPAGETPQKTETPEKVEIDAEELRKLRARAGYADRVAKRQTYTPDDEPPAPVTPKDKPKVEDYDDYNKYVDELTDWKIAQRDIREQQQTAQQRFRERQRRFNDAVATETRNNPEFQNKAFIPIGQQNDPRPTVIADMVAESEEFGALAVYFGENQAEAEDLYTLAQRNPAAAAREIGRLEAKLSKTTPQQRTNTRAPAPTKTVGSTETVAKDPENMTMEEYKAYRAGGGGK